VLTEAGKIGVLGQHPHELRRTAASLAIASGADVKAGPGRATRRVPRPKSWTSPQQPRRRNPRLSRGFRCC